MSKKNQLDKRSPFLSKELHNRQELGYARGLKANLVRGLILVFCLLSVSSYGRLEDHLKKIQGKSDIHKMRNIDFIYMINLDERPEKFMQSAEQLMRYDVIPYRFSAVNGWKLSVESINDVGLKYQPGMTPLFATTYEPKAEGQPSYEFMREFGKTYFTHNLSRGSIGCSLSHLSIIKDAWDSNYETIWVMEDDIEVIYNPHLISDFILLLDSLVGKDNWDVLFTDQDYRTAPGQYMIASGAAKRPDMDCSIQARTAPRYQIKRDISSYFREISARFGAHSMIIRRSGMKKLLDFVDEHGIFLPYDLDNYLHPDIVRFSLTFDLVSNAIGAASDNAHVGYTDCN